MVEVGGGLEKATPWWACSVEEGGRAAGTAGADEAKWQPGRESVCVGESWREARLCFRLSPDQPPTIPICLTLYYYLYSGHAPRCVVGTRGAGKAILSHSSRESNMGHRPSTRLMTHGWTMFGAMGGRPSASHRNSCLFSLPLKRK